MKRRHPKRKVRGATVIERSCTHKVAHPSEMDARLEAQKAMIRSRGLHNIMWVYPCDFCDKWHLTTRGSDARGRVTIREIAPNGMFG